MGYIVRDRTDGQVEIVLSRPVVMGVFPEREIADRVCAFLRDEQPQLADDEPAIFARGAAEKIASAPLDLDEVADEIAPAPRHTHRKMQLPAAAPEKPRAPAVSAPAPHTLSEDQIAQAFTRIQKGEKILSVAADFGLSMGQLRGMWANHKRQMQKYMAADGQQACRLCQRAFTPSISNPDTCARCSHE